jgi:hypothetical protein
MYDLGAILNEPLIEIGESDKGADIMWSFGYWPSVHDTDLA